MSIWFCIVSFIVVIMLILALVKIFYMKKSVREIGENLKTILQTDTNNLLTISSRDNDIKILTKELNIELKELRKQRLLYENGNQELKESITNISHDLRTPLTAISGYVELLKEENLNEKQEEYLKIINTKTNELTTLTGQLFDFSKSLDLENKVYKENCCINDILEETIASYYNLFNEKNIIPNIKICEKKVYRDLDKTMLVRIFENLISNVIRYSDNDCNIELTEDGKIIFSNRADKLDVTTVEKIFNRYYTVENARKNNGVGLSIAKQLVEMNGGHITSKYLKGILFVEIEL